MVLRSSTGPLCPSIGHHSATLTHVSWRFHRSGVVYHAMSSGPLKRALRTVQVFRFSDPGPGAPGVPRDVPSALRGPPAGLRGSQESSETQHKTK